MKRITLLVLFLGTSLLCWNLLTGCQGMPTEKYGSPTQSATPGGGSSPQSATGGGGLPTQFKTAEVKRFAQAEGLGFSQGFLNSFYDGLRQNLKKAQVADQIVDDGSAVTEADASNSIIMEGTLVENKAFFGGSVIGSEIKVYRRSDHSLIKTITARVPTKASPFNTDKTVGEAAGGRTAYEIKKSLN
jgi:hypothetical protein